MSQATPSVTNLGAYVHLPWCVKKCPYCDFNSHAVKGDMPEARYVDAIIRDIEMDAAQCGDRNISSVFFGGGTPSLFSEAAIDTIINKLDQKIGIANEAEITLEANPGTAEAKRFAGYRSAGVNRLSIGVQSFDDATLTRIGRIHNGAEALAAVALARASGFDDLNIDLMYAQPSQSLALALADIRTALALDPTHMSCYQLTIEPNTLFHARPPTLPDEESAWTIQEAIANELTVAGFNNYEVSAWAKPGRTSRHNINYWSFGDYLGIGAGAHAKVTEGSTVRRTSKLKHPAKFMESAGTPASVDTDRVVEDDERSFEFMLNNLRLTDGFSLELFSQRTGLGPDAVVATLNEAAQRGLISMSAEHVRPTALGRRFLNDLTGMFL